MIRESQCARRRRLTGASLALVALVLAAAAAAEPVRYGFYRAMPAGGGGGGVGRRVFGGGGAAWGAGAAVALLDRYWGTRCSAAALAPRWALTAAHCVTPRLAYVLYDEDAAAPVLQLYRHPGFRAVERDADVKLLHHDVGLVSTREDMRPPPPPPLPPPARPDAAELAARGELVRAYGFGRTERVAAGERPYSVRLRLVGCERAAWLHCACAVGASVGAVGADGGVCAGDSGGPVLWRGVQVGVTSMGPTECAAGGAGRAAHGTSVLTSLAPYAALIDATVRGAEDALRMEEVSRVPPAPAPAPALTTTLAAAAALLCSSRRLKSE